MLDEQRLSALSRSQRYLRNICRSKISDNLTILAQESDKPLINDKERKKIHRSVKSKS